MKDWASLRHGLKRGGKALKETAGSLSGDGQHSVAPRGYGGGLQMGQKEGRPTKTECQKSPYLNVGEGTEERARQIGGKRREKVKSRKGQQRKN